MDDEFVYFLLLYPKLASSQSVAGQARLDLLILSGLRNDINNELHRNENGEEAASIDHVHLRVLDRNKSYSPLDRSVPQLHLLGLLLYHRRTILVSEYIVLHHHCYQQVELTLAL